MVASFAYLKQNDEYIGVFSSISVWPNKITIFHSTSTVRVL